MRTVGYIPSKTSKTEKENIKDNLGQNAGTMTIEPQVPKIGGQRHRLRNGVGANRNKEEHVGL